jgi:hypothetical protein
MTIEEQSKAMVKAYVEAFNRGDLIALKALLAGNAGAVAGSKSIAFRNPAALLLPPEPTPSVRRSERTPLPGGDYFGFIAKAAWWLEIRRTACLRDGVYRR